MMVCTMTSLHNHRYIHTTVMIATVQTCDRGKLRVLTCEPVRTVLPFIIESMTDRHYDHHVIQCRVREPIFESYES